MNIGQIVVSGQGARSSARRVRFERRVGINALGEIGVGVRIVSSGRTSGTHVLPATIASVILPRSEGSMLLHAMPRFTPPDYETKFADFIRLCRDSAKSGIKQVVVANPSVIGDTHDELIESLSRLAEAGLSLSVTDPEMRGTSPTARPSLN